MTRRQIFWSGLLALTLLRIVLDLPLLNWRVSIFNLALYFLAHRLGMMKPAIVRLVPYPPKKYERKPQNCTLDVGHEGPCNGWPCETAKKAMLDLSPGSHR